MSTANVMARGRCGGAGQGLCCAGSCFPQKPRADEGWRKGMEWRRRAQATSGAAAAALMLGMLAVSAPGSGGGGGSSELVQSPAATAARTLARVERDGAAYARKARKFREAARVAAQQYADAHRAGPVDTLHVAAERLDLARGRLARSAADPSTRSAMLELASSLRAYSQALLRHKDGLEFEAPGAYTRLSPFELRHPRASTARALRAHRADSSKEAAPSSWRPRETARLQSAGAAASSALVAARHARGVLRQHRVRRGDGERGLRPRAHGWGLFQAPAASRLSKQAAKSAAAKQQLHRGWAPTQAAFPAFVGREVKAFPFNVMGNVMTAVNAV